MFPWPKQPGPHKWPQWPCHHPRFSAHTSKTLACSCQVQLVEGWSLLQIVFICGVVSLSAKKYNLLFGAKIQSVIFWKHITSLSSAELSWARLGNPLPAASKMSPIIACEVLINMLAALLQRRVMRKCCLAQRVCLFLLAGFVSEFTYCVQFGAIPSHCLVFHAPFS